MFCLELDRNLSHKYPTAPDLFSDYGPDEPRMPVLMAVKKTDHKRVKNAMANSESKKREMKLNSQKLSQGPKLPYPEDILEAIVSQGLRRAKPHRGNKVQKGLPMYRDVPALEPTPTTTQATKAEDPMVHGSAEPVPSVSIPTRIIPVKKTSDDTTIPVIVGYRRNQPDQDRLVISESIRRAVYRKPVAATSDVYTIENMLYGNRRPMHSNSIFYQKALAYLKQYRQAILQHRSYPERMADEETPKEIIRAYDPMTPLIHQQQGPTVPGGYQTSRRDNDYPSNEEQRTDQFREPEGRNQEVPRDAIAVQDGDHNVIGFLPVISLRGSSSSYGSRSPSSYDSESSSHGSGSSYSQSQSLSAQKSSSLTNKPLSPSLKLQNLLKSSRKNSRGENTIPLLTMGFRQSNY